MNSSSGLKKVFDFGKVVFGDKFMFNGCDIKRYPNGNIRLAMKTYLDRLKQINLSRSRRNMATDKATRDDEKEYRSLAGTLLYLGNGLLPQAALATSIMQQRLGGLSVAHLVDANTMLSELLNRNPYVMVQNPKHSIAALLSTFTDEAHPKGLDCVQTGMITGLGISTTEGSSILLKGRAKRKRG